MDNDQQIDHDEHADQDRQTREEQEAELRFQLSANANSRLIYMAWREGRDVFYRAVDGNMWMITSLRKDFSVDSERRFEDGTFQIDGGTSLEGLELIVGKPNSDC